MLNIAEKINNMTGVRWLFLLSCIFLTTSLMSLLTFGISVYAHLNYNLEALRKLQNGPLGTEGLLAFSESPMNLMFYFNTLFVPILQFGVIAFFMAIVVKCIAFYLIYAISFELVKLRYESLLISLLFLISPSAATHGVAVVGIWSEPAFFNASITVLCILTGFLLYLKNRFILAGLIFAVSLHFHQLYGVTPLMWLFIGILISFIYKQKRGIPLFLVGFFIILLSLFYLYTFSYSGYGSVEVGISEWYKYIYSVDPDDVSMIWTLKIFGFGLLPILFGAAYIAVQTKEKQELEFLMIGIAISFVLCMLLELLHRNGIFFGKLSEYFLVVELRRGFWIGILISLMVIVKNSSKLLNYSSVFGKVLLISAGTAAFLAPSYLSTFLFAVYFLCFSRSVLSILVFMLVLAISCFSYFNDMFSSLPQTPSMILFVLSTVVALILYKFKHTASSTMAMTVLLMVVFAYTVVGIKEARFSKSFDALTSNGIYLKTDYNYLYRSYKSWSGSALDEKAYNAIQLETPIEGDKIQLPPSQLSYQDQSYYGYPLVYSRQNISAPCFSIAEYQRSINNIKSLIGTRLTDAFFTQDKFYSKELMVDYIDSAYSKISINQLQSIRQQTGLRFYLIKTERDELNELLLCKGDIYNVYDLAKIKSSN
jgi:hypothetical protein